MDKKPDTSKLSVILLAVLLIAIVLLSIAQRTTSGNPLLDRLKRIFPQTTTQQTTINEAVLLREESVVIDVAEKVSPSVVTVAIKTPEQQVLEFDPFGGGFRQRTQGGVEQDIGSGFIVSEDGLIVTNKHVVSNTQATYKVVTQDDKEYDVREISRDPSNDIAVLKIDTNGLTPVVLGDSSVLKVGQFAMAIGTALGEFRHTVTTGVISGLGRGITAGSVYEGYVERLDNVIQTDAAINPGNSGGPLLNSAGQVVGVNVAVAQGAQNVGFAIPINIVKDGLTQYNQSGRFLSKPYLGVRYQIINERNALMNEVPQGAYIIDVVEGSPAASANLQEGDVVTEIDGQKITEDMELSKIISGKSAGDTIVLKVWRDGEYADMRANLSEFSQ
jgi:serine protease Do